MNTSLVITMVIARLILDQFNPDAICSVTSFDWL